VIESSGNLNATNEVTIDKTTKVSFSVPESKDQVIHQVLQQVLHHVLHHVLHGVIPGRVLVSLTPGTTRHFYHIFSDGFSKN